MGTLDANISAKNAESNTTVGQYVKPSLDLIDYVKRTIVENFDPKNVEVFDKYTRYKSAGLDIAIPLTEEVAGKREMDEAILKGAGDLLQNLLVGSLLYGGAVVFGVSNPAGWAAAGAVAVSFASAYFDESLGNFFVDERQKQKDIYGTLPNITISNPTVYETDRKAVFVIKFDQPLQKDLRLKIFSEGKNKSAGFVVGNTGETATNGEDYIVNTTYITIPAGKSEYPYEVEILNDNEVEKDEFFKLQVVVDNPEDFGANENFNFMKTATCTIKDGKLQATLSDITINESDGIATFTLSIDRAVDEDLTFYATTISGKNKNIDAIADDDYTSLNDKKVIIRAGETTATIEVNITNDDFNENNEIFGLWLTPDYKHIKDYGLETLYSAKATIIDDDESNVTIRFYNDSSNEGNNETESKQCKVSVIGLETLEKNQRVEVYISSHKGVETLTFTPNGTNSQEFTYYWNGNKIQQEDREQIIDGAGCLITTDEDGNESKTYLKVDSAIFKIKDDDRDPNDDLPETYDPLVIDLNNDGIKTTNLDYSINFDLNNDGFKEATSWIDGNDAFIAIDKNANGIIDNGSELFGNKAISSTTYDYISKTAKNGFEALRIYY